uniref:Acyl-coenzyme A oxidase n=1 Tax=Physcomitrium patens TaxID=3218 RepID=A0A7I4CTY5_PHYPA
MKGDDGSAAARRAGVLARHLAHEMSPLSFLRPSPCLAYQPPEFHCGDKSSLGEWIHIGLVHVGAEDIDLACEFAADNSSFDKSIMRELLDGHHVDLRDSFTDLLMSSDLFTSKRVGDRVFASPNFNLTMAEQRDKTLERILFLRSEGVFKGWLSDSSVDDALKRAALFETMGIFDHSLVIKLGVHIHLWGGSIQYLGTKRHHDKWLDRTEDYQVRGCFAMSELGHGSNVRGIETVTTYDTSTEEFIIDTPCESAQKYWIGGAAQHATHTIVFSQLLIDGKNEGVHAFVCQLRDQYGRVMPGIRIADCGHKIGLNGVDNGRIWFDKVRIPRENLLNAVADVTPGGKYKSAIKDPDQPEVLLLDYPSHRHRLLPLLAKTYAMSFAAVDLKYLYLNRTHADSKVIHVLSSGLKAVFSWHNLRTLQECREACGGQGLKTDNRVGQLKAEYDVQLTFEGDNNVLMQQVSKALLADYVSAKRRGKPLKGMGLEHINGSAPVVPEELNRSALRDSKFQLALFQLRERGLLELLTSQVTTLVLKGVSMTDAVISGYQVAEDLGQAFSERSVLESFLKVEQQTTGSMKDILGLLRSLYVLSSADETPVFLRYGYLTPKQSQLIHTEVDSLCGELRPQALNLVDAFGIPQAFLGPIAFDWVEYNSWSNVQ